MLARVFGVVTKSFSGIATGESQSTWECVCLGLGNAWLLIQSLQWFWRQVCPSMCVMLLLFTAATEQEWYKPAALWPHVGMFWLPCTTYLEKVRFAKATFFQMSQLGHCEAANYTALCECHLGSCLCLYFKQWHYATLWDRVRSCLFQMGEDAEWNE